MDSVQVPLHNGNVLNRAQIGHYGIFPVKKAHPNDPISAETRIERLDVILAELECLKAKLLEKAQQRPPAGQEAEDGLSIVRDLLHDQLDEIYHKLDQIECRLDSEVHPLE